MIDRKITHERLLHLADFLEKLPPGRFNYHHWVGDDWKGHQDLSCGTTACALGWAATMPEFRKLGLQLSWSPDRLNRPLVKLETDQTARFWESPVNAAMEVFGLTSDEVGYLFTPEEGAEDYNYSPLEVAFKIRQWVKTGRMVTDEELGIFHEE